MPIAKHNRRHGRRSPHGFTLIEMLVVIIIIAVVSSVIVPRYYDFAMRARFQESVQKVVSVFSEARNKAVQTGSDCVVRYDAQSATFIVEVETPSLGEDQPVALQQTQQENLENVSPVAAPPVFLGEDIIVNDFQVQSGQQPQAQPASRNRQLEVRFHEDGRADGAQIQLLSAGGDRAVVEVAPLTGRATVQEDEL